MATNKIIDKLVLSLKKVQDELNLADEILTGDTATESSTTGSTLPSVLVSEINPIKTTVSYSAIGAPVMVTDAKGKEVVATDGTIEIKEVMAEDGLTIAKPAQILTIEKGKLVSIEDKPEEKPVEEMTGDTQMSKVIEVKELELAGTDKYPWDKCMADQAKAGYSKDAAEKICGKIKATNMSKEDADEILEMAQTTSESVKNALIRSGLDISKTGSYCLNFTIGEDGTMTYGTLATNTYQDLMMAKEKEIEAQVDSKVKEFEVAMSKQKENYDKIILALKSDVKTINTNPQVTEEETKPLTKVDILKAEILNKKINNNK